MLPGIRFLFATMLLAVSLAICGVGATALLRAAQQNSAILPSMQAMRDPFPPAAIEPPTLALMRIEAPAVSDQPATSENGASIASSPASATPTDIASVTPANVPPSAVPETRDVSANIPPPSAPLEGKPATVQKPDDNTGVASLDNAAADQVLAVDDASVTAAEPAKTTVTQPSIVASKTQDLTPSNLTPSDIPPSLSGDAPQASQQTSQINAEKTASVTSPDADATLATGSLPEPLTAIPTPKPKPVATKTRTVRRVVRRVARATPRPQAAAKQASPFAF